MFLCLVKEMNVISHKCMLIINTFYCKTYISIYFCNGFCLSNCQYSIYLSIIYCFTIVLVNMTYLIFLYLCLLFY